MSGAADSSDVVTSRDGGVASKCALPSCDGEFENCCPFCLAPLCVQHWHTACPHDGPVPSIGAREVSEVDGSAFALAAGDSPKTSAANSCTGSVVDEIEGVASEPWFPLLSPLTGIGALGFAAQSLAASRRDLGHFEAMMTVLTKLRQKR